MPTFNITIQSPKAYLTAISGITRLTPRETELLGEIIEFMHVKRLTVLDDDVKNHIIKIAGFDSNKHKSQGYYNLVHSLKKKKILKQSTNKLTLVPMIAPGAVLQITFQEVTKPILQEYTEA